MADREGVAYDEEGAIEGGDDAVGGKDGVTDKGGEVLCSTCYLECRSRTGDGEEDKLGLREPTGNLLSYRATRFTQGILLQNNDGNEWRRVWRFGLGDGGSLERSLLERMNEN